MTLSICHQIFDLGQNNNDNISEFRVAVEKQGVGEPRGQRGGFATCLSQGRSFAQRGFGGLVSFCVFPFNELVTINI